MLKHDGGGRRAKTSKSFLLVLSFNKHLLSMYAVPDGDTEGNQTVPARLAKENE